MFTDSSRTAGSRKNTDLVHAEVVQQFPGLVQGKPRHVERAGVKFVVQIAEVVPHQVRETDQFDPFRSANLGDAADH